MGASSGPTTTVTPEKPILVKTVVPRFIQYGLGEIYNTSAENASRALASRNAAIDSLLGRPTTPLMRDDGEVVAPNMAPKTFDPGIFFMPEKNPFLEQAIEESARERQRRNRLKKQRERDMEEGNIFSRQSYLSALSGNSDINR